MQLADFRRLDKEIQFEHRDDLYGEVLFQNYSYVSEAVYDLYYNQKKSLQKVAKTLVVSYSAIYYWTKKWGWKLRPRLGYYKNPALSKPETITYLMNMKGKVTLTEAAEGICHPNTVYKLWNNKREPYVPRREYVCS